MIMEYLKRKRLRYQSNPGKSGGEPTGPCQTIRAT